VTETEALFLRLDENEFREGLNPIEKAQEFLRATKPVAEGGGGLMQEQLAERYDLTQGAIANKLRLLKLPQPFQQKLITAEMSERDAREILKWAHLPGVLEQAVKAWKKELPEFEDDRDYELSGIADELSRPMHQDQWRTDARRLKTTPELEKQLDVRELPPPAPTGARFDSPGRAERSPGLHRRNAPSPNGQRREGFCCVKTGVFKNC